MYDLFKFKGDIKMEPFEKGIQLVGDVEYVLCPYCDKYNGQNKQILSPKHLFGHKKKISDVRNEFPDHITITINSINKQREIGIEKSKETKTVMCYYHRDEDCPGGFYEVSKNAPNYIICGHCKNSGKANPDGRTKPEAYERRGDTLENKHGKGIRNPRDIPGVDEKIKITSGERHGGRGFDSEILADKAKNTMKVRYDGINIMQTEYGKKQFVLSLQKKYGKHITNPLHILEVAKRVSETLLGIESPLKGRTYEDIHGSEKAQQLIEDKRVSGVLGYLTNPTPSQLQIDLFELVKDVFPLSELEYCEIGKTDDYGKFGYALDIAIPEHFICIEFDGYFHTNVNQIEHDRIRDEVLKDVGWKTIRFNKIPSKDELIKIIKDTIKNN
jgi:hypothetical protein